MLARNVESLLELEKKQGQTIADLKVALIDIEKRVSRLENRGDISVVEARAAARIGVIEAVSGQLMAIGERLVRLEAGSLQTGEAVQGRPATKRLPRKKTG